MKNKAIPVIVLWLICGILNVQAQHIMQAQHLDIKNQTYLQIEKIMQREIDSLTAAQITLPENRQKEFLSQKIAVLQNKLVELGKRIDSKGYVTPPPNLNKIYHQEKYKAESNSKIMSIGTWYQKTSSTSSTNFPGYNEYGQSAYVTIDPTNSNIMYCGSYTYKSSNIYKTYDKGVSWECITNGIAINYNLPLVINPLNNNHLVTAANGIILISYDGGTNWYSGQDLNTLEISFTFSPLSSDEILASTYDKGIFRSTDGGITWTNVKSNTGFLSHSSVVRFLPGTNKCFVTFDDSLFSSVDAGLTWTPIPNAAFTGPLPTIKTVYGDGFFVSQASATTVYLIGGGLSDTLNLYKSTNSGASFVFIKKLYLGNVEDGIGGSFAVSQTDVNVLFVMSAVTYKSTDGGATWVNTPPFSFGYVNDLNAPNSNELYISLKNGLHYSPDAMATLQNIGFPLQMMGYDNFDALPNSDNFFVGTTGSFGYAKKLEAGDERFIDFGAGFIEIKINQSNPDVFYTNAYKRIRKTTDRGLSFTDVYTANAIPYGSIRYLTLNPLQNNTLYLSEDTLNYKIYVSYNAGGNWITKANLPINLKIFNIQIAPNDTTRYYANCYDPTNGQQLIFGSNSSGNNGTWSQIATRDFETLIVNTTNKNEFFFTHLDSVFKGVWNGTGLATIQLINVLPNDLRVKCLAYQSGTSAGLYIGTDIGPYFLSTTNNEAVLMSNGLPLCTVNDIYVHQPLGLISIATDSRGIWQSPIVDGCTFNYSHNDGLFQPPVLGEEYFEVSNQITSTKKIFGGTGVNVTYNAGNNVTMNVGFEVKAGSEMHAYIDGCALPLPSPRISLPGQYAGELVAINSHQKTNYNISTVAENFALYPNPAKDAVTFQYDLEKQSSVTITLLDISGRTVASFLNEPRMEQGHYKQQIPLYDINKGAYMVCVTINNQNKTYKLIVIK